MKLVLFLKLNISNLIEKTFLMCLLENKVDTLQSRYFDYARNATCIII